MLDFEKREYAIPIPENIECILGADIGGTNSNFGIFKNINGKLKLILSLHFKSQKINNFTDLVKDVLRYLKESYNITIKHSCFAAAGVVSENRDRCKPTNLDFVIDAKKIIKETELECATMANDFEIIGYGLNLIDPKNLALVKDGTKRKYAAKAILGAGTGLGKCILVWNEQIKRYSPIPSEGGHADFAAQTKEEFDLVEFIKNTEKKVSNISWEDILSGNGIERIHRFFVSRNKNEKENKCIKNNGLHPDEIFKRRNADALCKKTFDMYTTCYARCAKNFALDALALAGVYIAGGIAAKNLELFKQKEFLNEFVNCSKQMGLLESIPIWVITDYNVSLYGAARFMILEKKCISTGSHK